MKIRRIFIGLLVLFTTFSVAQAQMQMPPIPVDNSVRIGKLSNGLTYYIRHNNFPEHVANFYIAQRVGSINENDNQRGLAHFLEHMAFNGSKHFPGNGIIDYTRTLGVEFGRNLNAGTGIDQTVYNINDVPTTRQSAVDSCLLILSDWGGALTLDAKEIDKERDVIHNEYRLDASSQMRMLERGLPLLYPNSKYGNRLPIGLMSIVDNFKPQVLRDYYHKWYRPDNQAIIVVGDIDVDHVEAQIKKLFGSIVVPANAAKVIDEPVPDNNQAIYIFEKDKEQSYTQICLSMKHDVVPDSDKTSMMYLADQFIKEVACNMLNARFSELVLKDDCPMIGAGAGYGEYWLSKTKDALTVNAAAKEGKDLETLASVIRELQRARQFGFTATEYARAKADYLSDLEKEASNADKRKTDEFCQEYISNYLNHEPIPSIQDRYAILKQIAPSLPVEAVNEYAKQMIIENDTNLAVAILAQEKDGATYPTPEQMKGVVDKTRAEKLTAYVDNVKNEPLITTLPAKGKIVKETENKQLGFKELKLSNGATVILKKTDFKNDEIVMNSFSKGGKSLYGAADFSNLKVFDYAISVSGLGNFLNTELTKALAGKQASVEAGLGNTRQYIRATSTPKDIETMMQLVYLQFTKVNKDEKSFASLMSNLATALKNKGLTPESAFSDSLANTLNSHNDRFKNLDESDIKNINYDRILQICKERYANAGQFTFTFCGNFDEATLRPLIEQYIASLPTNGKVENFRDVRTLAKGNVSNQFVRKMESPKATAYEVWYNKAAYNLQNNVLADAAAQVLSMLYLKDIREDQSAAYSVGAYASQNLGGNDIYYMITAYCPMNPAKSQIAVNLLNKDMENAANKIDAANIAKVKEFMLKQADEDAKNNNHWSNILEDYSMFGLDFQSDYKKAVSALTPESVSAFLKNVILKNGNHTEVVMTPENTKK
jgi:zinc protease